MVRRKALSRGGRPCKLTVPLALALVRHVDWAEPLEDAARLASAPPRSAPAAIRSAGHPRFVALVEAIDRARRGSGLARQLRRNERDFSRLADSLSRNC